MPKKPPGNASPKALSHNPFAGLAPLAGAVPAGPAPSVTDAIDPPDPAVPPRAVVRLERKGHRGKEVTLVEQLGLEDVQLQAWLKQAKALLGCGGTIQDGSLVLQGDQRQRIRAWLEARGVRKLSVSG